LEPKVPLSPLTTTVPMPWTPSSAARTSATMSGLRISGSVCTVYCAWLDEALVPPPGPKRVPELPTVTW
jgi:hypothetical protein